MRIESNEKLGTRKQIKAFYDHLGRLLDTQRFFKQPALNQMLKYSNFEEARFVYELGCGTGRVAEKILMMNSDLRYSGIELSSTMTELTSKRLARFGDRATVCPSNGDPKISLSDGVADRFVSTYVFDLMSVDEIASVVDEAHRILNSDGRICLVSLTESNQRLGRALTSMWSNVHQLNPMLMGGCRPIELTQFIDQTRWQILHLGRASRLGLTSEVLIARKS